MITNRKTGEVSFVGAVLECPVYHAQAYNADWETVYARVWNGERVEDVSIGWVSYGNGECFADVTVDASPETLVAVKTWREKCSQHAARQDRARAAWRDLVTMKPGDLVQAVKGRKVKPGTRARVLCARNGDFGPSLKLDVDGLTVWASAENFRPLRNAAEVAAVLAEIEACGAFVARNWALNGFAAEPLTTETCGAEKAAA